MGKLTNMYNSNGSTESNGSRPLRIYLVDPVHNFVESSDIWTIPLNVLTIASYAMAEFGDQIDVRVFKFPDLAMRAIKEKPPNIIGVSNYIWNCELSKEILRFTKEHSADAVTVMGGPNLTQTKPWMTQFLKDAECDYYVVGNGEHQFKCLIGSILNSDGDGMAPQHDPEVHGVWYLDPDSEQAISKPITHIIKDLDEIPSPFLSGIADEFLEANLIPMIETVRGCPFPCTFCDWGDATFGKIYKYSVDRMKADIEHCRHHAKDERLMIDDANFGILPERDLELSRFMRDMKDKVGWPGKLIITWGQSKSDTVLEIAETLKDLCMMTQSSQSMDADVLKNIKRRNISDEKWEKSVTFCQEHNIDTYGELMIPLPGESLETYLTAVKYLMRLGVDFINTNPLILLEGAEMNTPEEREQYQMFTRWRLLENCYGVYSGRPVIEYQEMVLQTNTFSLEDYYLCRPLSWLLQMSWNLRRHDILLRLVHSLGVNPADFLIEVIRNFKIAPAPVREIFESFFQDTRNEFFETKEDLINYYSAPEQLRLLHDGSFRKLNTYYTSRVSIECNSEFIKFYEIIANRLVSNNPNAPMDYAEMIHDCAQFMEQRYLVDEDLAAVDAGRDVTKRLTFGYDILLWVQQAMKGKLWDFRRSNGITYRFFTDSEQEIAIRGHLSRYFGMSREYQLQKLQEPFHGMHKKHLLFRVSSSEERLQEVYTTADNTGEDMWPYTR